MKTKLNKSRGIEELKSFFVFIFFFNFSLMFLFG